MPGEIKPLSGDALKHTLGDLAQMRISVFHDWPYLYDGSMEYEAKYLQRYAETDGALLVGAYGGAQLVGAAPGEPLGDEYEAFQQPLRARGYDPEKIFYLAESVLAPTYRGRGIGHRFFDEREAHAQKLGFAEAVFCGVIRPDDHPMRPADYRPLDPFWMKRGYRKLDGVIVSFPWQDIGEWSETEKPMQVWYRKF